MAGTQRRLYVPPMSVESLPYGLMSVVQRANPPAASENPAAGTPTDDKWQSGVKYQPWSCDDLNISPGQCVTGAPLKEPTSEGRLTRAADPFTLYSWIECAPGGGFLDEAKQLTEAALVNNEARAVENEFWTGAGGTQPHLAANAEVDDNGELLQSAATSLTPTAVNVIRGMGLIEGALGDCYGSVGVIHVPLGLVGQLRAEWQVDIKGNKLMTLGGTVVAAGAGYPGTAPDGSAPAAGTTWIYGTGAVALWRSDITTDAVPREVVGRAQNTTVVISERTYVIGWNCCHFAALVALAEPHEGTV